MITCLQRMCVIKRHIVSFTLYFFCLCFFISCSAHWVIWNTPCLIFTKHFCIHRGDSWPVSAWVFACVLSLGVCVSVFVERVSVQQSSLQELPRNTSTRSDLVGFLTIPACISMLHLSISILVGSLKSGRYKTVQI